MAALDGAVLDLRLGMTWNRLSGQALSFSLQNTILQSEGQGVSNPI